MYVFRQACTHFNTTVNRTETPFIFPFLVNPLPQLFLDENT